MNLNVVIARILTLFSFFLSASAMANNDKIEFDFEAFTGISYDSNVSVNEIDLISQDGDKAINSGVKFSVNAPLTKKLSGNIGYSLSDLSYDTYSKFDLRTGLASANISYSLPRKTSIGIGVYHASTDLDGRNYLDMIKVIPSFSWFVSKSNFLRFSVNQADKKFIGRPLRDSTNTAFDIDWFHFFSGTKNFMSIGYDFKKEDAVDAIYDYETHRIKVAWTRKFQLLSLDSKFKSGFRLEDRSYSSKNSGGDRARNDNRVKAFLEYEFNVFSNGFMNFEYVYSDINSNVAIQSYDQRIAKMTFGVKL